MATTASTTQGKELSAAATAPERQHRATTPWVARLQSGCPLAQERSSRGIQYGHWPCCWFRCNFAHQDQRRLVAKGTTRPRHLRAVFFASARLLCGRRRRASQE